MLQKVLFPVSITLSLSSFLLVMFSSLVNCFFHSRCFLLLAAWCGSFAALLQAFILSTYLTNSDLAPISFRRTDEIAFDSKPSRSSPLLAVSIIGLILAKPHLHSSSEYHTSAAERQNKQSKQRSQDNAEDRP